MAEPRGAVKRAKPLTDEEYKLVGRLIDQGMTRNAIAEKIGRGTSTVTRMAGKLGKTFDRTRTAAATEAFKVDMAARRARLADQLLDDAELLRQRLWEQSRVIVNSKEGPEVIVLDRPSLRDTRDGAYAMQITLKGHLELIRVDQGDDAAAAKSMLAALGSALGLAPTPPPAPEPFAPTFEK